MTYLETYVESIQSLPQDLYRTFELMKNLDERSQALEVEVDRASKSLLSTARKNKKASYDAFNDPQYVDIQTKNKECVALGDEKVALARQAYEMIDKHIRRLDDDLLKFKADLQEKGADVDDLDQKSKRKVEELEDASRENAAQKIARTPGVTSAFSGAAVAQNASGAGAGTSAAAVPQQQQRQGGARKTAKGGAKGAQAAGAWSAQKPELDLPVDPNEPTYCTCNRVSFGQMIGCENADCRIEWFHLECIGLAEAPKGKWYCDECIKQRRG